MKQIGKVIRGRISAPSHYHHIILTLPPSTASLKAQVNDLMEAFIKQRERAYWERSIVGGCWALGITRNAYDYVWHPHLHILAEGYAIERDTLEGEWLLTTGGMVLDFLPVDSEAYKNSASDYIGKSPFEDLGRKEWVREAKAETKGLRKKGTFGTFRGTPMTPRRGRAKDPL